MDEPDNSLHANLFMRLIEIFLNQKDNMEGQLLITTHNTTLLDYVNKMVRTDSIWFADKDDSGASQLYSLADFDGLDKIKAFDKAYLYGRFGAVPKIDDNQNI